MRAGQEMVLAFVTNTPAMLRAAVLRPDVDGNAELTYLDSLPADLAPDTLHLFRPPL